MASIKLKNSSVAARTPVATDLILGELALNTADGKIYLKKTDNSVICVGLDQSTKQNVLGYTPLNPANNLSDVSTAATARTNLGLGTLATQNASAAAITGGSITGLAQGANHLDASFTTAGKGLNILGGTSSALITPNDGSSNLAFEFKNTDTTKLIYQDWSLGNVDYTARLMCSETLFRFQGVSTLNYQFERPVTFSGTAPVTLSGGISGNTSLTGYLYATGAVYTTNVFETRAAAGSIGVLRLCNDAGLARWYVGKWNGAESGSNAGSDFNINAYDDAGNSLFTPFSITRSNGLITTRGLTIQPNGSLQTIGVGTGSVAGNARGTGATDLQVSRSAATQVASGGYSFVAGGYGNTASGAQSIAMGGTANVASGSNSVCIGNSNNSSGTMGVCLGQQGTAAANFSTALGLQARTKRYGEMAYSSGNFSAAGDCQISTLVIRGTTTTATPTALTLNVGQLSLEDDSTVMFEISIVARRTDADNESAAYKLRGCIDRNAGAATTALVGTVDKVVLAEEIAAWDVNATADTTNGALSIVVTGEAAKTIRWVAACYLTEVIG